MTKMQTNRPTPPPAKADVIRKMLTEPGASVAAIARATGCNYSYVYGLKQRMAKRASQPRTGKDLTKKASKEAHPPLPFNPLEIKF